ncbi:MAG: PAS domain S-box protein, partial [Promethearchaeota archaeon]
MEDSKVESNFRVFTESVDVAIFLYQNYNCIYANPAAEKLTEYNNVELRVLKFWDFVHPDFRNLIIKSGEALERGEEIETKHVLKIIAKNGTERWINGNFVLIEYKGKRAALISAVDITKQKIAEEKLKQSEEKYRTLVENSYQGIVIIQDMKIVFANLTFAEFFGYSIKEILSFSVEETTKLIHPEDRYYVLNRHKELMEGKPVTNRYECRIIQKDKKIRIVEVYASLIQYRGRPASHHAFMDITERREAEKELKKEKNLYRDTINGLPGVFYLFNQQGEYKIWNKNFERISGYTSKEFRELRPTDFFDEPEKQKISDKIKEVISVGKGDIEANLISKNKTSTPYYWYGKKIMIDDELHIVGLGVDINELKKTEQKLIEREHELKNLEHIINHSPAVVFLWRNAEGWPVDFVSENVRQFGYEPEDFYSGKTSYTDIIHSDDLERVMKEVSKYSEEKQRKEFVQEYRILAKSGKIRWIDDRTWIRRNSFGEITHYQGIILDITERKHAKESLERERKILNNFIDLNPYAISIIDTNGHNIRRNKAFIDYFKIIPPDDYSLFNDPIINKAGYYNELLRAKNGEIVKLPEVWYNLHSFSPEYPNIDKCFRLTIFPILDQRGNIQIFGAMGEDVTEQKLAEKKLKESEERFRIILEKAVPMMAITDLEGTILMVNDLTAKMTGYSKKELLQMNITEIALEIIPMKHRELYWEKLAIGEHVETMGTHKRKDGSTYPIEVTLVKLKFKDKPVIAAFGKDISKRREAEQELKGSEAMYRMISENANDIISLVSNEAKFIYCNEAFERILGYTPEELIGTLMFKLAHPEDLNNVFQDFKNLIKTGTTKNIARIRCKDGNYKWLESIGKGLFEKNKSFTKLVIIARDITDRIRAEQELKESEEKFRTITEQSFMGICIVQDNKIKYINKKYADIWGYSIEEMMNWEVKDAANALYPDDRVFILEQIKKKQRGEQNIDNNYQYRGFKKSGEIIWLENYSKSILFNGRPADFITLIDITKRKEAEELIYEEVKKLKELDEMREDIITRVSHELKTPLTSTYMASEILLEQYKNKFDQDIHTLIQTIHKGCFRLKSLIENLLDVSSLSVQKLKLNINKENLIEIINECVDEMVFLISNRQLSLKLNMPDIIYH